MYQLSKAMEDRITAIGKELQMLLATSALRVWTGKAKEMINKSSGEVTVKKDSFINMEIPKELAERVLRAIEYLKETIAENPEFQYFIQVSIINTRFNVIACYTSKVSGLWEVQLAKAYETNSFAGIESDVFRKKFDKIFYEKSVPVAISDTAF